MDPTPVTWTIENSIPLALHPYNEKKKKRSCEIKVVPNLLGLVSLLGVEKELGWGERTI